MNFFFDTEFDEDGITINLISIGIVSEDGREYYAVSTQFNPNHCNPWVQANVLLLLPPPNSTFTWWTPDGRSLTTPMWKPKAAIAQEIIEFLGLNQSIKPEFWAHFADYDWVVLCQLFGRMIDLPKGMPFYCNDIKQLENELGNPPLPPHQGTEHDALQDAKWNAQVYQYLSNLKQPRSLFVGDAYGGKLRL
jgi:3' exoribonuclease, RNase T-like